MNHEQIAAHILGICERVERQFTLREIVARVMNERPEMIMEFAEGWGTLIRERSERMTKNSLESGAVKVRDNAHNLRVFSREYGLVRPATLPGF